MAGSWSDPDTLYAFVVGGGLFVSRDGGTSWSATAGELPSDHVMSLAVHPADAEVVYAGDMERGIYRSTDAFAVDPQSPDALYTATPAGVFISKDRGDTWTLPAGWPAGAGAIIVSGNPAEPGVFYALKDSGGLLLSRDGGDSWSPVN